MLSKIYVSGLGAIGCAYAGKLSGMNPGCIKVIADSNRINRYSSEGITINGKAYPFSFVMPEAGNGDAELIIIAVKQHHLDQCIKDIKSYVGKDTVILSLLNGISSEEIIGSVFGMEKMLYGFCVGTDSVREGTKVKYSSIGKIVFGEKNNTVKSDRVKAIMELFESAEIPYSVPENMIREQWWKFMMNVGVNQVSAILRAPYGVFNNVKEARELYYMASEEVVKISQKAGIDLTVDDIGKSISIIETLAPGGKTSMLQDVEALRKTEVEIFAGTVIKLGLKYNVDTPVNNLLFKMLKAIEASY